MTFMTVLFVKSVELAKLDVLPLDTEVILPYASTVT